MKRYKNLIKTYASMVYVQIGEHFIRKSFIVSVAMDETTGELTVKADGTVYRVPRKDAASVLRQIGFNE